MEAPFSFQSICLLAVLIGLLYIYLTWNFDYWTKRGIKSDDPHLIFGSLRDSFLRRRNMGEIYTDIYKAFPGEKVVGYFKFGAPGLIVRDPEIIHKILVPDFNSFRNNDLELEEDIDPILGRSIFVKKDEIWKKNRALITPAFTSGKIKAIFPQMVQVAKEFADYLSKHPEELNVKNTMSRYTTEIVARCAFGIEGKSFKENKPEMHELGKLIFSPDFIRGLKIMSFFVLPKLAKFLHLKMVPDEVNSFFNKILKDVIVYRQDNDIQRNDLVQYLIDVKRKTLEVEKGNLKSDLVTKTYTDDDVLSGCIQFFVEGYETSSIVLTNVLYQLAMHRDVQERLRAEIDEVLKKGEANFEAVHEMEYLDCVINETNRIQPAGFNLQKTCTEPYEMDVGKREPLKVEKGTSIVVPLYAIQNDPTYWEDPDQFKPERFANKEGISAKAKGVYLPFGDGPRMCIGVRIATTLMKTALIHIISRFDVLPTSKTPKKIQFDPTSFMLVHKGGMYLKFVERVA